MSTTTLPCQAKHYVEDSDGVLTSFPCGKPATHVITANNPFQAFMIAQLGGWEAYRAVCLLDADIYRMLTGETMPDADPGEDPGLENWGHTTATFCDGHAAEVIDQQHADDLPPEAQYEVIADELIEEVVPS